MRVCERFSFHRQSLYAHICCLIYLQTGKTSSALEEKLQAKSERVRETSEQKKVRLNKCDVDDTLLSNAPKGDCDTHTEENNGSGR